VKVVHLSHSDSTSGQFRAAYRVHRAMVNQGMDSTMHVGLKFLDDPTVEGAVRGVDRMRFRARGFASRCVCDVARLTTGRHSPLDMLPSGLPGRLNRSDTDICNLHWVSSELMSIEDVGAIEKPIVWTLHDMWTFCGTEYYVEDTPEARFRHGYSPGSRSSTERGLDIDRWTWNRKRKAWTRPMTIVSPSTWLADCARSSTLCRDWRIERIAYPLDTTTFRPMPRPLMREWLGLPAEATIIEFGAMGGTSDPRKGADLLLAALERPEVKSLPGVRGLIFGQSAPARPLPVSIPLTFAGRLTDDYGLVAVYAAADVMVVPSRKDNLPQTVLEALACGVPVVAFRVGGMPDMIEHKVNGWLAEPFDVEDLARGIAWVVENRERNAELSRAARAGVMARFTESVIAAQYRDLYADLIREARPATRISMRSADPAR
jgi:glycosyltransferase involved in cell wall biosynthesis